MLEVSGKLVFTRRNAFHHKKEKGVVEKGNSVRHGNTFYVGVGRQESRAGGVVVTMTSLVLALRVCNPVGCKLPV